MNFIVIGWFCRK